MSDTRNPSPYLMALVGIAALGGILTLVSVMLLVTAYEPAQATLASILLTPGVVCAVVGGSGALVLAGVTAAVRTS